MAVHRPGYHARNPYSIALSVRQAWGPVLGGGRYACVAAPACGAANLLVDRAAVPVFDSRASLRAAAAPRSADAQTEAGREPDRGCGAGVPIDPSPDFGDTRPLD